MLAVLVGVAKLVAIMATVLAGYRGGFIFPFMNAGIAIGSALALAVNTSSFAQHLE